ncbi:MAG: low molecular weight protein-tyrosine-phosphatase [Ancrocorticia sp.]
MTSASQPFDQTERAGAAIRAKLAENPQILVVCTGNICRSPMGEVVLKARVEELGLGYAVSSCGVSSEESGNPIYPPAARILRENGYVVPRRRARRASVQDLRGSGLILAMTVGHARSLKQLCEQAGVPLDRIHLWREFDGTATPAADGCFGDGGVLSDPGDSRKSRRGYSDFYSSGGAHDVPDPWYTGDFDQTFDIVEKGAAGIVTILREAR